MRVVVAPDEFKGSLTAPEVARHVAAGLLTAVPDATVVEVPVADGGEGTLDAAEAAGFRRVAVQVAGPTGAPLDSALVVRDQTAVVEMASASGLAVLTADELRAAGVEAAYALLDVEPDAGRCMRDAGAVLERLAERIARDRILVSQPDGVQEGVS